MVLKICTILGSTRKVGGGVRDNLDQNDFYIVFLLSSYLEDVSLNVHPYTQFLQASQNVEIILYLSWV